MQVSDSYCSPLGEMIMTGEETGLTGLWFVRQKNCPQDFRVPADPALPVFRQTKVWLDAYFAGADPGPLPPLKPKGSAFRQAVWALLLEIPYGETTTYGALAKRLARSRGETRMSAQAVGGAVGHNPIAILIPCHRVVGAGGSLTGYAAGLDKKAALLALESQQRRETGSDYEPGPQPAR